MALETDDPAQQDVRIARTHVDVARAALDVLTHEGWEAMTHAHLARTAGYSKTTLYAHWPSRIDLVTLALDSLTDMPHSVPTGDLSADLAAELRAFRGGIVDFSLDRILMTMAQWGATVQEIASIRDRIVADGEALMRSLLDGVAQGHDLEAAVSMLSGVVVCPSLMYGALPSDETIEAAVAIVIRGTADRERR